MHNFSGVSPISDNDTAQLAAHQVRGEDLQALKGFVAAYDAWTLSGDPVSDGYCLQAARGSIEHIVPRPATPAPCPEEVSR